MVFTIPEQVRCQTTYSFGCSNDMEQILGLFGVEMDHRFLLEQSMDLLLGNNLISLLIRFTSNHIIGTGVYRITTSANILNATLTFNQKQLEPFLTEPEEDNPSRPYRMVMVIKCWPAHDTVKINPIHPLSFNMSNFLRSKN